MASVLGGLLLLAAGCSDPAAADKAEISPVRAFEGLLNGLFDNFELLRQQSEAGLVATPRGQYRWSQTAPQRWRLELHVPHRPAGGLPGLRLYRVMEYDLERTAAGEPVLRAQGADIACNLHWRSAQTSAGEWRFVATVSLDAAGDAARDTTDVCFPTVRSEADWAADETRIELSTEGMRICFAATCDIADMASGHPYRRALIYTGWAAMHPAGPRPIGPISMADLSISSTQLHLQSEGGTFWFTDSTGKPTGYGVRLERPYYNSMLRVLKFGVVRLKDDFTLSYIWAAADSERAGINLRWLQSGLVLQKDAPLWQDPPKE